jgi:glutamate dehydrogenase
VPLRELVLALPRDRRWNSMARASLRDDLAAEQAALTADVLALRSAEDGGKEKADRLVRAWVDGWDSTQRRAAAQLADISAGDRHDIAELLVAVRTLRGLRSRTG